MNPLPVQLRLSRRPTTPCPMRRGAQNHSEQEETETMGNFGQRWRNLQPSKTVLFWSCIVCIALTMLLGFTWGGWMTRSTAPKMAEATTERARAELAAAFCVERFLRAADVRTHRASLQKGDDWNRTDRTTAVEGK